MRLNISFPVQLRQVQFLPCAGRQRGAQFHLQCRHQFCAAGEYLRHDCARGFRFAPARVAGCALHVKSVRATFPSFSRRGWSRHQNKSARSHLIGANGVVKIEPRSAPYLLKLRTAPSAPKRNGAIHFDGAATPPWKGGECRPRHRLLSMTTLCAKVGRLC